MAKLREHYQQVIPGGAKVLDLMSSWTSHLELNIDDPAKKPLSVCGLGLNQKELEANPALDNFTVWDVNQNPELPMYRTESFDVVICSLSVDYLTQPLDVFKEVARVLKPGGVAVFTFSNRMFPSKAIKAWRLAREHERVWLVGAYFHYCGDGVFANIEGKKISLPESDVLYAVCATKAI